MTAKVKGLRTMGGKEERTATEGDAVLGSMAAVGKIVKVGFQMKRMMITVGTTQKGKGKGYEMVDECC